MIVKKIFILFLHISLARCCGLSCDSLKTSYAGDAKIKEVPKFDLEAWKVDLFSPEYSDNGKKQILSNVAYHTIESRKLIKGWKNDTRGRLKAYLEHLEGQYRPQVEVPYHNQLHALDVLLSVDVLFTLPSLERKFSQFEKLALLVAAFGHDVGHPGYTNAFLQRRPHLWSHALPVEEYHAQVMLDEIKRAEYNFLQEFSPEEQEKFKQIIKNTVLATEMKHHFQMIADLELLAKRTNGQISQTTTLTEEDKSLLLKAILHLADISNPTKPLPVYEKWVDRVMTEFQNQGKQMEEDEFKMPGQAMFRPGYSVPQAQVDFIVKLAMPIWTTWATLVGKDNANAGELIAELERNKAHYSALLEQ